VINVKANSEEEITMFKKSVSLAAAAALAISVSTTAWAAAPVAELITSNGKVLVSQGEGFAPASGFMSLNAGDKVMVGAKSSAELAYGDGGCSVTLSAGSVVTIPAKAPCAKGETAAVVDSVMIEPVMGGAGYSAAYIAVGAVVIIGGIVLLTQKKKNNGTPISP
jgi:hypothetical protein